MASKTQVTIKIPKEYRPLERKAILSDIVERITERTQKENVDKKGKPFPKYSPEYKKSHEFKVAGKSKSKVNLTLSGDMLGDLGEYSRTNKAGEIKLGYEKGSESEGKAEGNILGSYGGTPNKKHARDFLGITEKELKKILKDYPLEKKERAITKLLLKEIIEKEFEVAASEVTAETMSMALNIMREGEVLE